jgi:hypothetical protein
VTAAAERSTQLIAAGFERVSQLVTAGLERVPQLMTGARDALSQAASRIGTAFARSSAPLAAEGAANATGVGYGSFSAFKRAHGLAGDGMQWHHVVEQSQIGRSGLSASRINSTDNLVKLPEDVHAQISAYYSSRPAGFTTTVRNTLNGLPFEDQYQFGVDIMRRAFAGDL